MKPTKPNFSPPKPWPPCLSTIVVAGRRAVIMGTVETRVHTPAVNQAFPIPKGASAASSVRFTRLGCMSSACHVAHHSKTTGAKYNHPDPMGPKYLTFGYLGILFSESKLWFGVDTFLLGTWTLKERVQAPNI